MERLVTGISGLDCVLKGGIPELATVLIAGPPGVGKTVLTQNILFNVNKDRGANVLYLSAIAEPQIKVIRYQQEFSFFNSESFMDSVIFHDIGSIIRSKGVKQALDVIHEVIMQLRPAVVAIDGINIISALLASFAAFREFLLDLSAKCSLWECTVLLVGDYSDDELKRRPESVMADGIIYLYSVEEKKHQERYLQILKMRGTGFLPGKHRVKISGDGLQVYPPVVPGPDVKETYGSIKEGAKFRCLMKAKHYRRRRGAKGNSGIIVPKTHKLQHALVRTLLSTVRHGVIVTNDKGQAVTINRAAAKILDERGFTVSPGKALEELGLGHSIISAVRSAISGGYSFFQKKSVLGEGKKLTHLSWDVVPLVRNDVVSGALLVFEDITEKVSLRGRKENWERLATAGEVAAGLAHEIRNPLATAGAAIQLLGVVNEESRRKELLGRISSELERINTILTNFLNLSKPQGEIILEPVNLVQVIEDLEFLLKSEASLHNVDLVINFNLQEEVVLVQGEANSLKQVLLNISKNAVEACEGRPKGGRVEISLQRDGGNVSISFKDNGPGISEENIKKVKLPFFTTKKGGTGLGLAISSAIIKRMGGQLSIESLPGEGTTVRVILPLIKNTGA